MEAGSELIWEPIGPDEWRIHIQRKKVKKPDPLAMLGYAREFRATRSTESWMKELREGESS